MDATRDCTATILVVDDDPSVRDHTRTILESNGRRVLEAQDGETALRLLRQDPIDLIVLDMWMPRMNGYRFLERLRGISNVPVIAVTGASEAEGVLVEARSGVLDHISKPFGAAELEAAVAKALARSVEISQRREKPGRSAEVYESMLRLSERIRRDEALPPAQEATRERRGIRRFARR